MFIDQPSYGILRVFPQDIRQRQREVFPDEIERGVTEEYPREHLPAQPAVFGIDPLGRKWWGGRSGFENGEHDR